MTEQTVTKKEQKTEEMPKETKVAKETPKAEAKKEVAEETPKKEVKDVKAGKKDLKDDKKADSKKVEKKKEIKKVVQKPKEKKKPKAVNKIEKTKEQKKLQEKIKLKKVPTIRGNFGKAWLRRKAIKKWQKWHKARGIDFLAKKEDGAKPKAGYRTSKEIRGLHPSGLPEIYIRNLDELKKLKEKNVVIRINGKIGKKTKKEMLKTAKEKKIRILN